MSRIRRKKCDATKPACTRCSSTGRTCDFLTENKIFSSQDTNFSENDQNPYTLPRSELLGAEEVGCFGQRDFSFPPPNTLPPTGPIYIAPISISSDEVVYFDYFRIACTEEFSGFFNGQLWKKLILQASYTEPFMLNAVLAIGAIRLSQLGHCCPSEMLHYSIQRSNNASEALSKVVAEMLKNNTVDWKTALLGSIVLLAIEVLHGNEAGALLHFRGGSSILKSLANEGPRMKGAIGPPNYKHSRNSNATSDEFDEVITAFTRLSIEQYPFIGLHSGGSDNAPTLPSFFETLDEVRNSLNSILSSMYAFIRQWGHQSFKILPRHPLPKVVSARLENLQTTFQNWKHKLNIFLFTRIKMAEDHTRAKILLVHYLVAWVKISTTFFADMLVYDNFLSEFGEIVAISEDIINIDNRNRAISKSPCLTLDIAMAQPLFFVARYCRDGSLRRRAINKMESVGSDGIYNGKTVAIIANWIVETEEGDMAGRAVSEEMRLRDVTFDIHPDAKIATVYAGKKNINGTLDVIHKELALH